MAGGAVAAGGSSLSQTQLVLLLLVAAIFTLLLTANIGLCWLYRRLLTEDQRQTRRAQKKKMSDVWVYQVTRPAHSPPPPPQPEDPPSQQILRKLRRSYDNLRSAVEAGEGEGQGGAGAGARLSREESQAIEELEVTADLFLHDTPHNNNDHHHHSHSHSRRSSFSVYDNDADHAAGPFLAGHDMDINAFTASDHVNVSASFMEPERSTPGHQRSGGILAPHCRSPVTTLCGDPGSPSSVFTDDDSVFYHDTTDPTVPSIAHLSVLHRTEDSATQNVMLAPNHTEVPTTNPLSALPDIDLDTLNGNVHLSSVTLEDFENHPTVTGTGRRAGGKKGRRGAKRRGSTYDNVATPAQAFPVAEFHNEAFHFTTGEIAAVEVVNDLDL